MPADSGLVERIEQLDREGRLLVLEAAGGAITLCTDPDDENTFLAPTGPSAAAVGCLEMSSGNGVCVLYARTAVA